MNNVLGKISPDASNEDNAATAFSNQSLYFDAIYRPDKIIQYKRKRVWSVLEGVLSPQSSVLELNAGTGDDAIHLAGLGHHVHSTDLSEGMQKKLYQKSDALSLQSKITQEICSFTKLDQLKNKGPYDCIFSNFAGLNCTGDLDLVLESFYSLLKPGGTVVLVLLPAFCFWESLLIFKGRWRTATRRWFSQQGAKAKIDDDHFTCWYYRPSYLKKRMKRNYDLTGLEGLCTIVPPSYIEGFAEKYPDTFSFLEQAENRLRKSWPWKYTGDYYIISFKKK